MAVGRYAPATDSNSRSAEGAGNALARCWKVPALPSLRPEDDGWAGRCKSCPARRGLLSFARTTGICARRPSTSAMAGAFTRVSHRPARRAPRLAGAGPWTIGPFAAMLWLRLTHQPEGLCLPGWRYSPTRDARTGSHLAPRRVSAWWARSPPSDAPRRTRLALRCPGVARAAQPSILGALPRAVMASLAWWRRGNGLTRLARKAECGGLVTLQHGKAPGPFRLCPQPHGGFRQGHSHALQGLGELVFGTGDGGGHVGEALP
jgi:hypothetical protein